MKLGISWNCYPGIDDKTQIALMRENSFETTFLASESDCLDDTVKILKQENIFVENLHGPCSIPTSNINDIWRNSERSEEMLARLMDGVEKCARLEIPTLVLHVTAGHKPPRPNDRGYQRFLQVFERAKECGITIACENIRPYGNLAFILEQFPEAGFCWDIGHEACSGDNRQFMPMFGGQLKAVHIHDNLLDGDQHMIPYDGKIKFDRVARQIAESPYNGSIMLELIRRGSSVYDSISPEKYYERAGKAAQKIEHLVVSHRNRM